jgi:SAM-dependent methyltransferase
MWDGKTKPTEKPEFGRAASAYAQHRLGFPASMYARLAIEGTIKSGMKHLDLGTGTGTLARSTGMMGLDSSGLDIDADMLSAAREIAAEVGLEMTFREGPAENTGEEDNSHDLVTAGQCWHWFDRPKAAAEVHRILKPGGTMMMCHYDWIALPGNVVEATERLIVDHCPDWTAVRGNGVYPHWFRDLGEAGFVGIESFSYDEPAVYSHEGWIFRMEASAGIARLSPKKREAFKSDLKALLATNFPADPLSTHHRVFCVWGRKSAMAD